MIDHIVLRIQPVKKSINAKTPGINKVTYRGADHAFKSVDPALP